MTKINTPPIPINMYTTFYEEEIKKESIKYIFNGTDQIYENRIHVSLTFSTQFFHKIKQFFKTQQVKNEIFIAG